MFAYQDNMSSIDVINYLKTKVSNSHLTFMIKADLKNFLPSIKKRYLMKGFAELVDIKDNKFYHLLKSYFRCGYMTKILSKSKHIGARKVKIIHKNITKDKVYAGSLLAPLFSNIINSLILKEINQQIEKHYTLGQQRSANKTVSKLATKKDLGAINNKEYKKLIKKTKPTCFTNKYKRAWYINYNDTILILGHLSKKNRNSL